VNGRSRGSEAFEARYAEPLVDPPPLDEREAAREARAGQARALPEAPFALRGCLLTPDEALEDHYLVISGGVVADIAETDPGVAVLETNGIILPGLLDLHGHPEFNVFAPWEPPRLYRNRYQWRRSKEYAAVVRAPWTLLAEETEGRPSLLPKLTRYAEARALIGGATAIQGASGKYPDPHEALVRNVDRYIFGARPGRSLVDLGRARPDELRRLREGIKAGDVKALYVHLAEGTDETSRGEFRELAEAGLLTEATVVIHGTALTAKEFGEMKDVGAKLVWSPQSNLRLYGETTKAAEALSLDLPVALGADWLPSGSPSLLDELRVARRILKEQGSRVGAKRLVQMVTSEAARVAGLGENLGHLRAGKPADVLILERHAEDPWESVLQADRRSVELVVIGGDVAYGRSEWVKRLAGTTEPEPVIAWGKQMALDLSYSVAASPAPPPRLADLRAELLARYNDTGPIFA
jgi:5-methylthioadenosine/S-adenosylhomocysteine deaminase